MPFLTIQFKNLTQRVAQLARLNGDLTIECGRALYQGAEAVMTKSKEDYVPVKWGNLRASGHVSKPETLGGMVKIPLGFGGPAGAGNVGETNDEDVGYAEIVHEDMNARHTVGSAKFLEIPLRQSVPDIQKELDRAAERAIRNSGLK